MPAGKLSVAPLTIHGLAQNGFPTSQTFIGCYVSPSEKQRTNSASGPEPQYSNTLNCNVGEEDSTLFIDVINEDPSHPGPIGSTQVQLNKVFESGRFEDWVPLTSTTGGPLGHIFMRLNFTPNAPGNEAYGVPPPVPQYPTPPAYGQAEDRKVEVPGEPQRQGSATSLGPESPMPSQYGMGQAPNFPPQTPIRYGSESSIQSPGGSDPTRSTLPGVNPAYNPPLAGVPSNGSMASPTTPGATSTKKPVPEWVKYGGAALAGAAAVGLGAWAVNAMQSDEEEDEEVANQKREEMRQQYEQQMQHRSTEENVEEREFQEERKIQEEREEVEEEEKEEETSEEEKEEETSEEEEDEEEDEEEEEQEEEEEEEEEEEQRHVIDDSKWR